MKKKSVNLYLKGEMAAELEAEAKRLDRSVSWVAIEAWKRARAAIRQYPTPPDPEAE